MHIEKGKGLHAIRAGSEANVIAQQYYSRFNGSQTTTILVCCIELHTHGGAYIKSASLTVASMVSHKS